MNNDIATIRFFPTGTNRPATALKRDTLDRQTPPDATSASSDQFTPTESGLLHRKTLVFDHNRSNESRASDISSDAMPHAPQITSAPERQKFEHLWGLQNTGNPITIAIVSSGADVEHPDLKGHILPGTATTDELGNGTHIAGIIAGPPR